jgi:hypothetical protein
MASIGWRRRLSWRLKRQHNHTRSPRHPFLAYTRTSVIAEPDETEEQPDRRVHADADCRGLRERGRGGGVAGAGLWWRSGQNGGMGAKRSRRSVASAGQRRSPRGSDGRHRSEGFEKALRRSAGASEVGLRLLSDAARRDAPPPRANTNYRLCGRQLRPLHRSRRLHARLPAGGSLATVSEPRRRTRCAGR